MGNINKLILILVFTIVATDAMAQFKRPRGPRGGTNPDTGVIDPKPTPPQLGVNGNCCIQASGVTGTNCTQSNPASTPALNQFLPAPSSPGYAAAYASQYAACQTLAPKCIWNTSNPECAAPRQPTPTPTPRKDPCLSTGGFYCGSTPTVANVECAYGSNQIYLLSGGMVNQFIPIIACPSGVCPPNTPPSGGCNKPGGLGTGTWISCGFNNIGGMPTGYYCR